MAAGPAGFLQYHEPDIISLLVLISFFFFLSSVGWVFNKAIRAGLIGQILIGILYGTPVGDILDTAWQETFMALGYIGLVLIIFEGGLTIRLDLLKANFLLSTVAAAIGIITPIALCYLLLYLGFKYGALETFIIGAALSTTSIGTTFVVISSSASVDFTHTKVGTVLISAALFDDVVGLIMVSVISNLGGVGEGGGGNIGWIVGRPIVASFAIGTVSPLLAKFAAGPLYRRFVERHVAALGHRATICVMTFVLSAHLVVCAYAGASLLFGAFLAGTFLSTLPDKSTEAVQSEGDGLLAAPSFHDTFEAFISGPQAFVLEPLFFASIGFAIPFKKIWTGTVIWRGIVLSLLMAVGKVRNSKFCTSAIFASAPPELTTPAGCRRSLHPNVGSCLPEITSPTEKTIFRPLGPCNAVGNGNGRSGGDWIAYHPTRTERHLFSIRGGVPCRHLGYRPEYHPWPPLCWLAAQQIRRDHCKGP